MPSRDFEKKNKHIIVPVLARECCLLLLPCWPANPLGALIAHPGVLVQPVVTLGVTVTNIAAVNALWFGHQKGIHLRK